MKPSCLFSLLVSFVLLLNAVSLAFETDQFNLPPVPLADIGDEVSEHVEEALRFAVAKVNADIAKSLGCLEKKSKDCGTPGEERAKLGRLRLNDAVAEVFFRLMGDGNLFTTKLGHWMKSHKFRSQPSSYKTKYSESIYILNPANYLTISPTVRLYGTEFGTDKLDHFFQQGYKYYTIQKEAMVAGLTSDEAAKKAVKWGQKTERTYFGLLVSGVYSNADLSANYAGMKFYQGLTVPIRIGEREKAAPVVLAGGTWKVDEQNLHENLLKPFIADHMNEALNPSSYRPTLVGSVRRAVKKYACSEWKSAYPDLTAASITDRSKSLELWNGEDYGYTKKSRMVTIADTCFDLKNKALSKS